MLTELNKIKLLAISVAFMILPLNRLRADEVAAPQSVTYTSAPTTITGSEDRNYISHTVFTQASTGVDAITPAIGITSTVYYDGLGRQVQSVTRNGGQGNDLADYIEYDNRGRVTRRWMPGIGTGGGNFTPLSALRSSYGSLYPDDNQNCCNIIDYDGTVRSRPAQERKPGEAWHNAPGVRYGYAVNSAGRHVVARLYVNKEGNLVTIGNLTAGGYRITEVTDEDGRVTIQATDRQDRVVLNRQVTDSVNADTYFVYDLAGNLRYVLPPLASREICETETIPFDTVPMLTGDIAEHGTVIPDSLEVMRRYAYIYRYDGQNRLIEKRLPGMEPISYVYDGCDLLRFSQDGNQRAAGEWSVYAYDNLFRPVFTATMKRGVSAEVLRAEYATNTDKATFAGTAGAMLGYDYTATNFTVDDIKTVNYYDDYVFLDIFASNKEALMFHDMTGYDGRYVRSDGKAASGLAVGGAVRVLGDTMLLVNAVYYDKSGRVVQTCESNHLGGYDRRSYRLAFAGNPLRELHEHSTADTSHTDLRSYTYDNLNRPLTVTISHDNAPAQYLYANSYNALGQLSSQVLGENVAETLYDYNLHGNVTGVSSPWFTQRLFYETRRDGTAGSLAGEICAQEWEMCNNRTGSYQRQSGAYDYSYDRMGRLVAADYTEIYRRKSSDGVTFKDVTYAVAPDYSATYSYDMQGNMTAVTRMGLVGSTTKMIDNAVMEYEGNQMVRVSDATSVSYNHAQDVKDRDGGDVEMSYDANGNLTSDSNRKITEIICNELNLPQAIYFADGNITEYIYDATGRRLRARYSIDNRLVFSPEELEQQPDLEIIETLLTRDYVAGYIYVDGVETEQINETGYRAGDTYHYYLRDYQGNNRVRLTSAGEQKEWNAYYPYGGAFGDICQRSDLYRYSGKELDKISGLDWYDFSARHLDPAYCRFTTPDPLTEQYPHLSPYAYCMGNPIKFIDPTGMDYIVYIDLESFSITIFSAYYTPEKDTESAQQAADFWNNLSGRFYTDEFVVNFLSIIVPVDTQEEMTESEERNALRKIFSEPVSDAANTYMTVSKLDPNVNGKCASGKFIYVTEERANTETGAHEMGHTLGLLHSKKGLMTATSSDTNRTDDISVNEIETIINRAIIGTPLDDPPGNFVGKGSAIILHGTNPNPFKLKKVKVTDVQKDK